jgi:3-hydroxybutyryl-CoA dehydrogenase
MSEITSESLLAAIKTVGVLGAGQMGAGIAQVAAQTGYDVLLADVSQQRADAGKAGIIKQLGRLVEKGKLAADERDKIGGRITAVVGAAG